MALARYTDTFWFPDGTLATSIAARVFPQSSSALATLWADAAGTVALAQPLSTSAGGVVTFWAEAGEYWLHLDSEAFPITVGMSQDQAGLSTGIASGGEVNVNALNPLAVDISATDGYIVDYLAGTQAAPVITRVKTAAQTVALDAAALARTVTWWLLDSAGAVVQQATKPTNEQRRTHLVLGVTALVGGVIVDDQSLPVILPQQANQLVDLMDALGPFIVSGNAITANGANLKINQSAGTIFSRAFNHYDGPTLTNNPHVKTTLAQTPAQFRYATQSTSVFGGTVTDIDVAHYDAAGVITPIGGGANSSTIHRVWMFATNTAPEQMVVQYGQTVYASLAAAVDQIGSSGYTVNPILPGLGALVAYVVATRTATNLSDPTQAVIVTAGKFATP
jgi:hypothetical protein